MLAKTLGSFKLPDFKLYKYGEEAGTVDNVELELLSINVDDQHKAPFLQWKDSVVARYKIPKADIIDDFNKKVCRKKVNAEEPYCG